MAIEAGNGFTVSSDWVANVPGFNSLAPKKGFLFSSEPSAAALLYKRVLNAQTPIYLTSFGGATPPPGQHTLLPNGNILIFFATQEAGTTFKLEGISTKSIEFQTAAKPKNFTILYNESGMWEIEVSGTATEGGDASARESKL